LEPLASATAHFRIARYAAPPAVSVSIDWPTPDSPPLVGEHVWLRGRVEGPVLSVSVNGKAARFHGHGTFVCDLGSAREARVVARALEGVTAEASVVFKVGSGTPAWFASVPEAQRPPLPLPEGIVFSGRPRRYQCQKTGMELVFMPGAPGFFLGEHDVTNDDFEAFVEATKYKTAVERGAVKTAVLGPDGATSDPARAWEDKPYSWRDLHGESDDPVVAVSWSDAVQYAKWAGMRLPTKQEWTHAARFDADAKRYRPCPWGDESLVDGRLNFCDKAFKSSFPKWSSPTFASFDGYDKSSPVGAFPAGAAWCGALDMYGDVWQWCADGPSEERRFVCGGAWDTAPSDQGGGFVWGGDAPREGASETQGFRVYR
jgi:formylglycine-generating enzyme required for sulfatase activity